MRGDDDIDGTAQQPPAELRPVVGTAEEPRGPGIALHLVVLAASAISAFLAYSLVF